MCFSERYLWFCSWHLESNRILILQCMCKVWQTHVHMYISVHGHEHVHECAQTIPILSVVVYVLVHIHVHIDLHTGLQALLTLTCLYLGSFFLRKSTLSYIRAKPVLLPPPKAVRNPKQTMTSEVVLYIFAKICRSSLFGTLALPGCKTSTT